MSHSSHPANSLPEPVRQRALAAGADTWLEALPSVIANLCAKWQLVLGRTYPDATEAFVADVAMADDTAAVLKILLPSDLHDARREITVLKLADGNGCARLLRADEERSAMLLERLGRPMADLNLPLAEQRKYLVDCAQQLWRKVPTEMFGNGADKGRWLMETIEQLWAELAEPCSRAVIDHALWCADRRIAAHSASRAVLVHGDIHAWNALEVVGPAAVSDHKDHRFFKLVDPDGLVAEPEYDLGVILREDPEELLEAAERHGTHEAWSLSWRLAREMAVMTGCDATAIWEWAFVERVSTGLVCRQLGVEPIGSDMLAAAEAIVAGCNGSDNQRR